MYVFQHCCVCILVLLCMFFSIVVYVFQDRFDEVMNTQEFLILPPEEVSKLLASDDLNIPNEEIIYQALLMWVNHDLAARKKFLPKLMSHIRLPLMSPQVRVEFLKEL